MLLASGALAFEPGTKGKKLISYGQDWPNPAYLRQHIVEMEKHPFDGVVIGVTESREPVLGHDALGWKIWSRQRIELEQITGAIEDLRATKFNKFTDNFILIESMPGDVNFFEPDFDVILHNVRMMARVAKRGGCVGLEFDPEEYSDEHVWSYSKWSPAKRGNHTEEEYIAQARYRGEQFMGTICSEFDSPKILMLFGPALTSSYQRGGKHDYRLLAPFVEGMCRGADGGSQIIDGFEQSYGYRTTLAFAEGRKAILAARETFSDKQAFDHFMRVGFGLWNDCDSGHRGWYPDQPELNYFQPDTFQTAVFGGLSYSDEYVWVWREKLGEWEEKNFNPAYDEAMRQGRSAPAKISVERKSLTDAQMKFVKRASEQEHFDDTSTFGDLLKTHDALLDLPADDWRFKPDPELHGDAEKWFKRDFDDSRWENVRIKQFWEEQGFDYDGVAWYRRTIDVPAVPSGKKIELVFGAVDEGATVWLNGEQIGAHDDGEVGWDKRFSIDVTGKIQPGQNQLAVRVLDRTGPGGIWKSIKLLASPRD